MIVASSSSAVLVFIVAWYVLVVWAVSRSAKKRGRDPWGWGFLALFIGLLAYIPLWIAGTTDNERARRAEVEERARMKVRNE